MNEASETSRVNAVNRANGMSEVSDNDWIII